MTMIQNEVLDEKGTKNIQSGIQARSSGIGRDPDSLEMSVFEESIPERKILAEMEEAGVKRLIITIFGQSRDESLPILDQLAELNG